MSEPEGDVTSMSQNTVTINGTEYDAHTGLPIQKVDVVPATPSTVRTTVRHSQTIHKATQKSKTLNRRFIKNQAASAPKTTAPAQIKKSPAITKFAPHPAAIQRHAAGEQIAPVRHHPLAQKAHQVSIQKQQTAPKPATVIKQEAIHQAMSTAPKHSANNHLIRRSRPLSRFLSVGSASLALLLLGGYFTYLNMPNLSVRVAAAQAGIDATYPAYRPDGYGLSGAVAYKQGEVSMKFASNSGPQNYTIAQTKSGWDSSAVLDNYVKEKAGDNYITYSERGLTIYTYGSSAAWVNNGVLYTIGGDAPLSSDQIRRIATSM
jgi:hypothetical protein